MNAFRPPFRRHIATLTSVSPALEDLADSFPALLFALATGYGNPQAREAAFAAIVRGRPLKEAASAAGLPLWTRRLPPSALVEPLPSLPGDEPFAQELLPRIPHDPSDCALWADRLFGALRMGGRDLALWIGREPRLQSPATNDKSLQWIIAWAWASLTPDSPGHHILRAPWTPKCTLRKAIDEVAIWRKRVDLVGALADPRRDPWFEDGQAGPYEIRQLKTVMDFIEEATTMENCLDQYASHLAYGRVRIFSVRRAGESVATFEVTIRSDQAGDVAITQVRGPRNRRASAALWQTITLWLARQERRSLRCLPVPQATARAALARFWQPYRAALEAAGLHHRLGGIMYADDDLHLRPRPIQPDLPPRSLETTFPAGQLLAVCRRLQGRGD